MVANGSDNDIILVKTMRTTQLMGMLMMMVDNVWLKSLALRSGLERWWLMVNDGYKLWLISNNERTKANDAQLMVSAGWLMANDG